MTPLSRHKNRGYWTVNGSEYDNKVKAILSAQEQELGIESIQYHYNDTWWDQADWSEEPTQTLEELYLQRAKQIREKYETVILRFSGGSDSVNILKTFVDNNIKLDVVTISLWSEGDSDNTIIPNNIEKVKLAFPLIKELKAKGADFEVVVSDLSPLMSKLGNDLDWFMKIDAPRFSVVDVAVHQWVTLPEYQKWNNNKTCYIVGVDKPQVWVDHGKIWYFKINDLLHTMHNPANDMVPEPFYWTADMPEIPIKQAHAVKNFYRNRQELMQVSSSNPNTRNLMAQKSRLIPVIYPKYFGHVDPTVDTLPYYDMTDDGNQYRIANNLGPGSPRGMGQDSTIHLSPYYNTWREGIEQADKMIQRTFKNMDTIWQGGLTPIFSKSRWIGK
jgi:hypothetical protein